KPERLAGPDSSGVERAGRRQVALPLPLALAHAQRPRALRTGGRMKLRALSRPLDPASMTLEAFAALQKAGPSRRNFLKTAGVLIVGFSTAGRNGKLAAQNPTNPTGLVDATQVDSWIAVAQDESVTAYSGKCEFGQGFSTVQTQLVAEELYVPLIRVTL